MPRWTVLAPLVLALGLFGCASRAQSGDPASAAVSPDAGSSPTPAATTFTPGVGQAFSVVLPSLSTAGYAWHLQTGYDAALVQPNGTRVGPPPNPALAGASANEVFDFRALAPGQTSLVFVQYRSWEGPDHAADTRRFGVTVHAAP